MPNNQCCQFTQCRNSRIFLLVTFYLKSILTKFWSTDLPFSLYAAFFKFINNKVDNTELWKDFLLVKPKFSSNQSPLVFLRWSYLCLPWSKLHCGSNADLTKNMRFCQNKKLLVFKWLWNMNLPLLVCTIVRKKAYTATSKQ